VLLPLVAMADAPAWNSVEHKARQLLVMATRAVEERVAEADRARRGGRSGRMTFRNANARRG
jgi:hypothetical protein